MTEKTMVDKLWKSAVAAASHAPTTGSIVLESSTILEIDALLSKLRAPVADERAAFEKSGITGRLYRNTEPGFTDEYQDAYTQFAWRGWQARAALEGLK